MFPNWFLQLLHGFIVSENLSQLVSFSTHSTGNTLDLVITNTEDSISNLWIDSSS